MQSKRELPLFRPVFFAGACGCLDCLFFFFWGLYYEEIRVCVRTQRICSLDPIGTFVGAREGCFSDCEKWLVLVMRKIILAANWLVCCPLFLWKINERYVWYKLILKMPASRFFCCSSQSLFIAVRTQMKTGKHNGSGYCQRHVDLDEVESPLGRVPEAPRWEQMIASPLEVILINYPCPTLPSLLDPPWIRLTLSRFHHKKIKPVYRP